MNGDDSSQAILGELSENCGPGMTVLSKSLENCWRIVEQGRQFSAISWRTVGELLVRNGSSQQILGELLENCETGTTFLSQFLENCWRTAEHSYKDERFSASSQRAVGEEI